MAVGKYKLLPMNNRRQMEQNDLIISAPSTSAHQYMKTTTHNNKRIKNHNLI